MDGRGLRRTGVLLALLLLPTTAAAPAWAAGARFAADGFAPRQYDLRFDGDPGGTATLKGGKVADAGDVNGDGLPDLVVGAPGEGQLAAGAAYVVFGSADPASTRRDTALGALGAGGFAITTGADLNANLGITVAGAGDVNGDGRDDVLVASLQEVGGNGFRGATWVVFGRTATTPVDLTNLGDGGFRIDGRIDGANASQPFSADGGEDVDGDGRDDVILGFPGHDVPGGAANDNTGEAFVVFGRAATSTVDVANLGAAGFRLLGVADGHQAGNGVALTPDMNGDGRAEVVVGSPGSAANGAQAGEAAIVFGRAATTAVTLGALGSGGFRVEGEFRNAIGSRAGSSVAGGDLNADGVGDVVVSAPSLKPTPSVSPSTLFAGGAVVVFGRSASTTVEADALGSAGYRIDGAQGFESAGLWPAGIGDLDGDGLAEIALASGGEPASGRAWVVHGRPAGSADVNLAAPGTAAVKIEMLDDSVTELHPPLAINDRNGDGLGDLAALSPRGDVNGPDDGTVFVFHGRVSETLLDLGAGPFPPLRLEGPLADAAAGASVADAGDVNGDAIPDRIVGAPDSDVGAANGGSAYVVFGTRPLGGLDLASPGAAGFRIDGGVAARAGFEVDGAGDLDGDGLDDLVVHSFAGTTNSGAVSVVYGKSSTTPVSLASLGSAGFTIDGFDPGQRLGSQVAGIGDVNGDDRDDVAFSNPTEGTGGKVYVVFGKSPRRTGTQVVADIDAPDGFAITGTGNDFLGQIDALGDVTGDGRDDILVTGRAARATVIYGRAATTTIAAASPGGAGYTIDLGSAVNGDDARRAAGLGDVNGDGRADLGFVGGFGASGRGAGAAVLFGKGSGDSLTDPVDLADAVASGKGFLVDGPPGVYSSGDGLKDIAGAGDADGDGRADILVGDGSSDPLARAGAGSAWVVYGRPGPAFVDLSRAGYDALRLAGPEAGAKLGDAVDGLGLADTDTRADLLVGAAEATALGRAGAGAALQLPGAALPRPVPPAPPGPGGGGGPAGGGPPAAPTAPTANADRTAPTLSRLALSTRRFRVGSRPTATGAATRRRAPQGTTIRWTLSEGAVTTFTVERLTSGRRAGSRCVAPTARNRARRACTRTTRTGTLRRAGKPGANRLTFTGRIGRRALKPGPYRLTARATDAAGNAARPRTATFTVVR